MAELNQVSLKIDANVVGAETVAELQKRIEQLSAELLTMSKNADKADAEVLTLDERFDRFAGAVKATEEATAKTNREISEIDKSFGKFNNQLKITTPSIKAASDGAKAFDSGLESLLGQLLGVAPATKKLGVNVDDIEKSFASFNRQVAATAPALSESGAKVTAVGQSFAAFSEKIKQAEEAAKAVVKPVQVVGVELGAVAEKSSLARVGLTNAFSLANVRSSQQITAEILKLKAALNDVANSRVIPEDAQRATAALNARLTVLNAELLGTTATSASATAGVTSFGVASTTAGAGVSKLGAGIAASGLAGAAALGPIAALALGLKEVVQVGDKVEVLNRSFAATLGSAGAAAKEMEFLRATSNKLGLETLSVARSYQGLVAATQGTSLAGAQTREVFEAVARAMSTLGKSSAETEQALRAVAQIASKGTVSMEELRGQLGEALPGALQAAAKGAGITVERLVELVSAGKVLASDIFPALTKGLNAVYGAALPPANVTSELNRLKNTLTDIANKIAEGGATKATVKTIQTLDLAVSASTSLVELLGKSYGELAGAIATGGEVSAEFREETEATGLALKNKLNALVGLSPELSKLEKAQFAANQAAREGRAQFLQINSAYETVTKSVDGYVKAAEKSLEAVKAEQTAIVAFTAAFGTETEQRFAAANAVNAQSAALDNLAKFKAQDFQTTQALLASMDEELKLRGGVDEELQKQIKTVKESLAIKEAESRAATASAASKRVEAAAIDSTTLAYADNSKRVNELKAAYELAAGAVQTLVTLQSRGKDVTEALSAAQTRAGQALLLYRDALKDAAEAANRNIDAVRRNASLQEATIALDRAKAQSLLDVARARGDENGVTLAQNQLREIEIKSLLIKAEASRIEAAAILASVAAKRAELLATGQMNEARKAELDALTASAELKKLEAERSKVLADALKELQFIAEGSGGTFIGMGKGIKQAGRDAEDAAGSFDRLTQSTERAAQAGGRFDAERTNRETTRNSNASDAARRATNRTAVDNSGLASLLAKEASNSLSAGDLSTAQAAYSAAQQNLQLLQSSQNSFSQNGAASIEQAFNDAKRILEKVKSLAGASSGNGFNRGGGGTGGFAAPGGGGSGGFATPGSGGTGGFSNGSGGTGGFAPPTGKSAGANVYNLNLNLGGDTYPVQTDEQTGQALVRALEGAKNRRG